MEEGSLEERYFDQVSGVCLATQASEPKPHFSENRESSVPRACALDFNTAPSL